MHIKWNNWFYMRFLFAFISTLLITGCYQTESKLTKSLIYCSENRPHSFNPQISHDIATLDATTHQLYNRLVKIDPISQRFISELATHWRKDENGLGYTFFLRENVPFHNTDYFKPSRFLNADDVIFSFNRMLDQNHPFHGVNRVSDSYFFNHPFTNLIEEIVRIDDHTVKFILKRNDVTLLANLAAHYSVILSQEYAQHLLRSGHPEKIDFYPIGSGPFQFKNFQNSNIIRYTAHTQYWGDKTNIDYLYYDITTNNSKRYAKLLSGECDVITYPSPSQLRQMSIKREVVLSSQPTSNVALWAFNSSKKTLENEKIRQALSYAIDQKTIVNAVFFQSATTTDTLLARQSWAVNPRTEKLHYKPQLALKLLHKHEYNFDKKLTILTPRSNSFFNPNFHKTAELIQANLSDIGVKSRIISLSQTELEKRLLTGDYDTYLTGMNVHNNDPDSLFRPLFSCDATALEGNSSQWCDQQTQELLDNALLENRFIQRIKAYYQLQKRITQLRLYYPIAHVLRIDAFNKNISGLQVNPLTGINFHYIQKEGDL